MRRPSSQRGGDRLLDEDVLARGDRVERDVGVLRGGRRDADRIDVAAPRPGRGGTRSARSAGGRCAREPGWRRARPRRRRAHPRCAPTSRRGRSPCAARGRDADREIAHAASSSSLHASATTARRSGARRGRHRRSGPLGGARAQERRRRTPRASTPTSTFQPAATVSTHSVSSRSVRHGTPQR